MKIEKTRPTEENNRLNVTSNLCAFSENIQYINVLESTEDSPIVSLSVSLVSCMR